MKSDRREARFEVQDILPISLTIIVAGIGIAYGLSVLGDLKDDFGDSACATSPPNANASFATYTTYDTATGMCTNGSHYRAATEDYFNASGDNITAVAKFPSKLGLIVTVIVAAILNPVQHMLSGGFLASSFAT